MNADAATYQAMSTENTRGENGRVDELEDDSFDRHMQIALFASAAKGETMCNFVAKLQQDGEGQNTMCRKSLACQQEIR